MSPTRRASRGLLALGTALTLAIPLTAFAETGTADAAPSITSSVRAFARPTLDAKPMARMWFPDAGAGATREGLALVAKQIKDMAAAGFGGVEISYLADTSSYGNSDARTIGFGSENWRKVLKQLLRTANAIPGGFKIDITITSHWPPVVNNIDPNDDEQQQQATVAYRKLTTADVTAGKASLPLPTQRTKDYAAGFGGGDMTAAFLFVDKLSAATLAKVAAIGDDGKPVFELGSLKDVSAKTSADTVTAAAAAAGTANLLKGGVRYAGRAAGIPDQAKAAELGINYQTQVVDKFGPEPASANFTGKIDASGNRRRMADWQYTYSTDLSGLNLSGYTPSAGESLAVGDYVVIGSYHQGTGQVQSGGASVTQYNRTYATDYFSAAGARKVFRFWSDHILDRELTSLLKKNGKLGTSIFEDSIEIHHDNPLWTANLLSRNSAQNGYDSGTYAPVLSLGSAARFDDTATATRLLEDYNLTLGALYETEHADLIKDWAAGFGYSYRAQAYTLAGLDIAGAASVLDIPEGDNSTSGDGLRNLKAATNLGREKILSMETTTFAADMNSTWQHIASEVNGDFSHGVNRSIFHGSAFAKTFNGFQSSWPGWNFMRELSPGFSSYNARQVWWGDADTFSDYVARSQGVLQAGRAKVDLAVLLDSDAGYNIQSGNSLQELLNSGYSYNLLSQALLSEPTAYVKHGVLDPQGTQYKALLVKDATKLSVATAKKLIAYAKAGLPIILLDSDITRVYGTNKASNNDTLLRSYLAQLAKLGGVTKVDSEAAALTYLQARKVTPAASYEIPFLEASKRVDGRTTYYYLFNSATSLSAPATAGDDQLKLVNVDGLEEGQRLLVGSDQNQEEVTIEAVTTGQGNAGTVTLAADLAHDHAGPAEPLGPWGVDKGDAVSGLVDQDITLTGSGVPYLLNAWTGEVSPISTYTRSGNSVKVNLDIPARDADIIALVPKAEATHAVAVSGGVVVADGSSLLHEADAPGTYSVRLSSGATKRVSVSSVPADVNLADGWQLSLQSWGPDAVANKVDPTVSKKTTVQFGNVSLGAWKDLPATSGQLASLGVSKMSEVSGIGWYSRSFSLGADWKDAGALLRLQPGDNMVTEVVVNGRKVDDVDQFTSAVDLRGYLKPGANTIKVKIATSLNARYRAVNGTSGMWADGASGVQDYGLAGVSLDAYRITRLGR